MSGLVVVDASLAFKWLVSEEHSDRARAISRLWANEGIQAAAPYLMTVDVTNSLHRRVVRGELTVEDAVRLLEYLLASGIELRDEPVSTPGRCKSRVNLARGLSMTPIISHWRISSVANTGPPTRGFTARLLSLPKTCIG